MIVHPAKHLFEAKFPSLEDHEEEIFYQHPIHDIKCNQLGTLYYEEGKFAVYDKGDTSVVRDQITRKNCGSKLRVIWECYTGKITLSPHFLFDNANPLDTRKENLILSRQISDKERQLYLKKKKKFVHATVDHLMKIEARMEKMGVDKDTLYEMLQLPYWAITARKRKEEGLPMIVKTGGYHGKTTREEADEVEKLYLQGLSLYAIIKRMDWTSASRVKKVVRDRGLTR